MTLERYHGSTALVLGAAGFIGRWVARSLTGAGASVHLAVREATSSNADAIFAGYDIRGTIHPIDVLDESRFNALLAEVRPAVTFNLIGYGVDPAERDASLAEELNAIFVDRLCRAVDETRDREWPGVTLVHVGTALEYGRAGGALAEDTRPQPSTLYGETKLLGTETVSRYCGTHGLPGVTARLFMVYGPGEHEGRLMPALLQAAEAGRNDPIPLTSGRQRRDFTYVADVANALLDLGLADPDPGAVVNVATGRLSTVREFVETAARILRLGGHRLQFGALPTRREEMAHEPVSVDRLRRLVGRVPETTIAEGVERTIAFSR